MLAQLNKYIFLGNLKNIIPTKPGGWSSILLMTGMFFLILLLYARLYTVTQDLKRTQNEACQLRHSGRTQTNEHLAAPLQAALQYLGNAINKAADKQKPGPEQDAAKVFGNQFLAYAAQIQPFPNPNC